MNRRGRPPCLPCVLGEHSGSPLRKTVASGFTPYESVAPDHRVGRKKNRDAFYASLHLIL